MKYLFGAAIIAALSLLSVALYQQGLRIENLTARIAQLESQACDLRADIANNNVELMLHVNEEGAQ